jgi:type II secretory pathway predicted ATPase ExeA
MTDIQQLSTAPPGRNAVLPAGIWPTRPARMVMDAIALCRMGRHLGVISCPSGIGKTTAARAAVQVAADEGYDAHYVRMTITAEGLQPGLMRIGKAIGAPVHTSMGAAEAHDAILGGMLGWTRGGLLVLDEAQFMSDGLIFAIRDIADELVDRGRMAGIVMMGDGALSARINGRAGPRARHFEPLRGRLGASVELAPPDAQDFSVIAWAQGVTQPQAADLVARVGAGRGGLHNVARMLTTARGIAGADNPITLGVLRTAAQVAGVGA